MLSANDIKTIRSLREKKYRDSFGLFVVEGEKMVAEALASGLDVERVIRREEVGEKTMERLSGLSTPPPVLAVVRQPSDMAPERPSGLCLALDSIRDPGNLGTILRIADWFGVDTVYASPDTVEVYNPKVIQASMGTVFRKRPVYCDLPSLCESFASAGLGVFGTFLKGDPIYSCDLPSEGLIVMGNESEGVSDAVAAKITRRITIPCFAKGAHAESLNVAVATAVTVSEFRRK
ncbi:MAG: RNA methyltransferase [Bacteroidales bacterium]|nr:RNA methyltransferase [Bacteroidales bacterium]